MCTYGILVVSVYGRDEHFMQRAVIIVTMPPL
jgi:hypothetical protein